MELLLGPRVTEGAGVTSITEGAVQPLIGWSNHRARRTAIEATLGHSTFILAIVVVGTRVALTTHTRWFATGLRLVTRHHMQHV